MQLPCLAIMFNCSVELSFLIILRTQFLLGLCFFLCFLSCNGVLILRFWLRCFLRFLLCRRLSIWHRDIFFLISSRGSIRRRTTGSTLALLRKLHIYSQKNAHDQQKPWISNLVTYCVG